MDNDTLSEIGQRFSTHSPNLGRIFLCCVTGQQMLMITDHRVERLESQCTTICLYRWCVDAVNPFNCKMGTRRRKSRRSKCTTISSRDGQHSTPCKIGVEATFLVYRLLMDPLAVIGVCGRYNAGMDSVRMTTDEEGQQSLEVLPYVDPSFFPCTDM